MVAGLAKVVKLVLNEFFQHVLNIGFRKQNSMKDPFCTSIYSDLSSVGDDCSKLSIAEITHLTKKHDLDLV